MASQQTYFDGTAGPRAAEGTKMPLFSGFFMLIFTHDVV
jgi:hypothetical protein